MYVNKLDHHFSADRIFTYILDFFNLIILHTIHVKIEIVNVHMHAEATDCS